MADEDKIETPNSVVLPEMLVLLLLIVLLCIPFLCYPLLWFSTVLGRGNWVTTMFAMPYLLAYYYVPTALGILYLSVTWGLLAMASYRRAYRRKLYGRLLIFYAAVATFYTGYIIWWYSTGQQWDFL